MTEAKPSSWQNDIIYQVYPASFNEGSTREQRGIGSLQGIIERLDYLSELGVNAIWVSPFFKSPMRDGGYDISDAQDVNPDFGTIDDAKDLIRAAHERGIKVMIDFIPNHTSDQHEWFQQSRQSRDNPKSDWYVWSDGVIDADGNRQPPNNWASVFSLPQLEARKNGEMPELADDEPTPPKSAWTWCEERQQYYLHSFADFQPDLNWHNLEVRAAQKDTMRFWLDLGVDGFRIDAVNYVGKDPGLTNEEQNTAYIEGEDNPYDQLRRYHSCGYPDTFYPYIQEMIDVLKESKYQSRNLRIIFEAYMEQDELRHIDAQDPRYAASFNFGSIDMSWSENALARKLQVSAYYAELPDGAIANQVNGNHDKPRKASRHGEVQARAAAVFNLMLPGNIIIYNGEELGLTDHDTIPADRIQDPNGLRDPARTPIIWDHDQPNAGFSGASSSRLYLPQNPADADKAVTLQEGEALSDLSLYRAAIKLRKQTDPIQYIPYTVMQADGVELDDSVVGYGVTGADGRENLVLTNFDDSERRVRVALFNYHLGHAALSSIDVSQNPRQIDFTSAVNLKPYESLVITDLD